MKNALLTQIAATDTPRQCRTTKLPDLETGECVDDLVLGRHVLPAGWVKDLWPYNYTGMFMMS